MVANHMTRMYCINCDWSASTADGYSQRELNQFAIEHFNATGHSVISDCYHTTQWADDANDWK